MSGPVHRPRTSHGDGRWSRSDFASLDDSSTIEETALIFRPEHIQVGANVYIGHQVILKAYPEGELMIGDGTWIGEQTYLNSAGSMRIGCNVGIGVGVRIITSTHSEQGREVPILHATLNFAAVEIGDDSDIGVSTTILPGVRIGRGVQVAAGAVVTKDLPDYCVAVGVPAQFLRWRP